VHFIDCCIKSTDEFLLDDLQAALRCIHEHAPRMLHQAMIVVPQDGTVMEWCCCGHPRTDWQFRCLLVFFCSMVLFAQSPADYAVWAQAVSGFLGRVTMSRLAMRFFVLSDVLRCCCDEEYITEPSGNVRRLNVITQAFMRLSCVYNSEFAHLMFEPMLFDSMLICFARIPLLTERLPAPSLDDYIFFFFRAVYYFFRWVECSGYGGLALPAQWRPLIHVRPSYASINLRLPVYAGRRWAGGLDANIETSRTSFSRGHGCVWHSEVICERLMRAWSSLLPTRFVKHWKSFPRYQHNVTQFRSDLPLEEQEKGLHDMLCWISDFVRDPEDVEPESFSFWRTMELPKAYLYDLEQRRERSLLCSAYPMRHKHEQPRSALMCLLHSWVFAHPLAATVLQPYPRRAHANDRQPSPWLSIRLDVSDVNGGVDVMSSVARLLVDDLRHYGPGARSHDDHGMLQAKADDLFPCYRLMQRVCTRPAHESCRTYASDDFLRLVYCLESAGLSSELVERIIHNVVWQEFIPCGGQ
jgi:hypothetical protein